MYSYEERLKAVQLYIQYDKSYASVFRELGYRFLSRLGLKILSNVFPSMVSMRKICCS